MKTIRIIFGMLLLECVLLNNASLVRAGNSSINRQQIVAGDSVFSKLQRKQIRKYISKISCSQRIYYDMLKANPYCSYIYPYNEKKGVYFANQIERIINPIFSEFATITKCGRFFSLTTEDLHNIQKLYEQWWNSIEHGENCGSHNIKSNALEGSIYKWEIPSNCNTLPISD